MNDLAPPAQRAAGWERAVGLIGGALFVGCLALLLFASAGRNDLLEHWAYLALWATASVLGVLSAPAGLIYERLRSATAGEDRATAKVLVFVWLVQHILAGLDAGRMHWTDTVPATFRGGAFILMALGLGVIVWAQAVNPFFSSAVRIHSERGHYVVAQGPYRWVRHPAYGASLLVFVFAGLALNSWLAAGVGVLLFALILRRTIVEDELLRQHLSGYAAYAERVRYRLFPYVW
ncbi:MAG: isoprenylcysteine carboxylmethyltransferase family protein [Candidatus Binatia bacterium]|nr:isoprenylcysteine carboxylmethyltransferase family protein [Candidatus Binatia bacterium]